ncbi:MAG: hypothetical protein HY791_19985 [Deltaproteobacteria bacterium]|nr:hypothetical protein [Deltaproteobacteria bacterium]
MADTISTLRKLGNFVATLFPGLETVWDRGVECVARRLSRPRWRERLEKWRADSRGRAIFAVVDRFVWTNYSVDRVQWSKYSAESVGVLRPVFSISLLLCLALPIFMTYSWPALQGVTGAVAAVSALSVILWMAAIAISLGGLLAGAARSNRFVLVATELLSVACLVWASFGPPVSLLNVLPPVTGLFAIALGESRLREGSERLFASLTHGVVSGLLIGPALCVMTPLGAVAPTHKLFLGFGLGPVLGVLAVLIGRRGTFRMALEQEVALFGVLAFAHLVNSAARGSLTTLAGNLLGQLGMLLGYLWPAWYFVGVGVLFALLRMTRAVVDAGRSLVPERRHASVFLGLSILAALATWSSSLVMATALNGPPWLASAASSLHALATPIIWSKPLYGLAADWLKWVFAFDVLAMVWLLASKRLDAERLGHLLTGSILAIFLVSEYLHEFFGFQRSATHSAFLLFSFSTWLLWLLHQVGLRIAESSSPRWPAEGRIAIIGGLLVLVIATIHARAASHDPGVMDEIFLYMFRGILDVGIPYAIFVYASKKLGAKLPLPTHVVMGLFALGGLLALFSSAFERFMASGYSIASTLAVIDAEIPIVEATGRIPFREGSWTPNDLLLRGAVFSVFAFVIARWIVRRVSGPRAFSTAVVVLLALAFGLASFSKTRVELPFVPLRYALLVAPRAQSMAIDQDSLFIYLSWVLPATLVALGAFERVWLGVGSIVLSVSVHVGLAGLWPREEPLLRATGTDSILLAVGLLGFAWLLLDIRRRLETGASTPWRLWGAVWLSFSVLVVGVGAVFEAHELVERPVGTTLVKIPESWEPVSKVESTLRFQHRTDSSWLAISKRSSPGELGGEAEAVGALRELMQRVSGPKIGSESLTSWERFRVGAKLVDFELRGSVTEAGSGLVVPTDHGVWVAVVVGPRVALEELRWDLARIATALPDDR